VDIEKSDVDVLSLESGNIGTSQLERFSSSKVQRKWRFE
jgi:hypothetical protein